MDPDQSASAHGERSVPLQRPRRLWDGHRFIEAMTICRRPDGQFTRKRGDEPPSQLVLPFNASDN